MFLAYQLQGFNLSRLKSKGGQPLVSQKPIYSLKLRFPTEQEQKKIAQTLAAADREIETLQFQLIHLQQEKKALMQQLLTGKRRVKIKSDESLCTT